MQATLRKMAKDLKSNGKTTKVEFGRIKINEEYFYFNQELQKLEPQRFRKTPNNNVEHTRAAEKGEGNRGIFE